MHQILKPLLSLAAVATLTAGLAGCQNDPDDLDVPEPVVDEGINAGKLSAIPPETRSLILADLGPDAHVTGYEILPTAEGTLYEVNFIRSGNAESKVYDRDGLAQALPSARPAAGQSPPIEQSGEQGAARDVGDLGPRGPNVDPDLGPDLETPTVDDDGEVVDDAFPSIPDDDPVDPGLNPGGGGDLPD